MSETQTVVRSRAAGLPARVDHTPFFRLQQYETMVNHHASNINALAYGILAANVAVGWYDDPKTGKRIDRNVGEMIALAHSELSEALEGHRKGLQDDHLPHRPALEVELADAVIRILDLAAAAGLDIGGAVAEKLIYNSQRADHKREARAAAGGKAL